MDQEGIGPPRGGGALLALDMRCGKSKITVDLVCNYRWKRTLIVCPHGVILVWPRQFTMHAPMPIQVIPLEKGLVAKRAKDAKQALAMADVRGSAVVVVVNYDAVWRSDMSDLMMGTSWDALICDEIHRLRSPNGRASTFMGRLADRIPYRLGLSGTPLPHSILDAFGVFRTLDKQIYGLSYVLFKANYTVTERQEIRNILPRYVDAMAKHLKCPQQPQEDASAFFARLMQTAKIRAPMPGETWTTVIEAWAKRTGVRLPPKSYEKITDFKNRDDFHQRFHQITYRVMARDVFDLPLEQDDVIPVRLSTAELNVYRQLDAQFRANVRRGTITPQNGMVRLLRLIQATSGHSRTDDGMVVTLGTSKADVLKDWLEDQPEDEPIVIVAQWRHDLDQIRAVVESLGRSYAELSGRRKEFAAWYRGERTILGMQTETGAEGEDFTRSRTIVYFSMWYTLDAYQQSRARISGPDQTRTMLYVHLVAAGTKDEQVYAALEARQNVIERVLAQ